jgi:maltose alpha-D-glucosyltransferase / alpha-amylase
MPRDLLTPVRPRQVRTRPLGRARPTTASGVSSPDRGQRTDPLWYKDAVIYEIRVRSFYDGDGDGVGDFRGLTEKLDYLEDLGVTALWLLPFYPSPLRDDGYDISDYTSVHPDCGTLGDFKRLLREAHSRGLRVITELVLNHTSDQHPWFQRARRAPPGSAERAFYVWSNDAAQFGQARIIFKDSEPSNWSWDPEARAYYWHRFYAHQPDLNYHSPAVRREIMRAVDFWLSLGVDGLRLDAVPYLFEREGTSCENLPETHEFLRDLRRHVDGRFDGRMLLAEANQWPEDAVRYLEAGGQCHMAFHFPLMPRLYLALRTEDRFPITDIWAQTPTLHESCQWALFLRNHDELSLEMVTDEERELLYRAYAEEPRMRLNLGIRRRLAPLLSNNRRSIELLNGLLLSLPGTPVIYYGDELGMGDNVYLGDRNGVRTPMQWSADRNAGFSSANSQQLILPPITDHEYHYEAVNVEAQAKNRHSLLWWMKRLIALRQQRPVFSRGTMEFVDAENPRVVAFVRRLRDERVLVVANLSRFVQLARLDLSSLRDLIPVEIFGRTEFPPVSERPYYLTLGPHGFYWFDLRPPRSTDAPGAPEPLPVISLSGDPRTLFDQHLLEPALERHLRQRRWFGGKARGLKSVAVVDVIELDGSATSVLALARIEYLQGEAETYLLPLATAVGPRAREVRARSPQSVVAELRVSAESTYGVVFDATADPEARRSLLDLFSRQRRVQGHQGHLHVVLRDGGLQRRLRGVDPRPLRGEQSNTTLLVGSSFVLKLIRRPGEAVNPDLEVGRYLCDRSFPHVAPLKGWVEYRRDRGVPVTLALLHGYVENRGDAWHYAREELRRYLERALARRWPVPDLPLRPLLDSVDAAPPPEVRHQLGAFLEAAALLGRRTAELHLALAAGRDDPAFVPEPASPFHQRALLQAQRNQLAGALRLLRQELAALPEAPRRSAQWLLHHEARIADRFEAAGRGPGAALRIRCHGDLHLGQVLHTGKDFVFIDFEGEPARPIAERRAKRSCLVDVAGMLRSLHYASATALRDVVDRGMAHVAAGPHLERCATAWQAWSSLQFLRGYLPSVGSAPLVPADRAELRRELTACLLEKAFYELSYELNHRPGWVGIPLEGIRQLVADA